MTADTHSTDSAVCPPFRASKVAAGSGKRRFFAACVCLAGLLALVGCKSNKDSTTGSGVSRPKDKTDPLVYGPTSRIPRQDLPLPDRATGPKTKTDPLTTPTGGKAGYIDDPERFKGTYIPGKGSTPAALAGRIKDGDELKIESPGVTLTPASGTQPGGSLNAPPELEPLYAQLDKFGVKREDRFLEQEGMQWVFRASVPLASGTGAKRQYSGVGPTAADAVKQVLTQLSAEK